MRAPMGLTQCMIAALVVGWLGAGQLAAQTVEPKSVQLLPLQGAERERFAAAHNAARKAVGVAPLAWSDELSKVALESLADQKDRLIEKAKAGWATKTIVLPEHRSDYKYGEN